MGDTEERINYFTKDPDGSIRAYSEIGPNAALHAERNRAVQQYAAQQLPHDYGLVVRYVDEIGTDRLYGRTFRGGVAFRNDPYNPNMITDILIDRYAFDSEYLRREFKGIELDWKDVVLHECGHAAYLDFMPSVQGPVVLDGAYLMMEYYSMLAAARLPGAMAERARAARLSAVAELYLSGELG